MKIAARGVIFFRRIFLISFGGIMSQHLITIWINRLSFLGGILAAIALGTLCLQMCVSVFFRYVLRDPLGWYEEATRFLMVWGAMLGMAYTLREGRHIRLTTLTQYLSPKGQKILEVFMDLIGIAVLAVFMIKGAQFTLFTRNIGEISPGDLRYPIWLAEVALPVGGALFILQYLVKFWADLKGALTTQEEDQVNAVKPTRIH